MTFNFTSLHSADGKFSARRPIIPITLIGPKGSWTVDAMVDSGADRSLFDMEIGTAMGIDFSKIAGEPFGGIGKGSVKVYTANVQVQVEGIDQVATIPVGFVKDNNAPTLLGQEGFFDAFKISFDRSNNIIDIISSK